MIPGLLGEPSREEAIIIDTIRRGYSELIAVNMPNMFFDHGGYTSFRLLEAFCAPLDLRQLFYILASFWDFIWHLEDFGSYIGALGLLPS